MTPITHYALKKMEKKGFNDLSGDDQDKVKSVLFLLDKFCIGEFHELTNMCSGGKDLPRSYLIKQCKDDFKTTCNCHFFDEVEFPFSSFFFYRSTKSKLILMTQV